MQTQQYWREEVSKKCLIRQKLHSSAFVILCTLSSEDLIKLKPTCYSILSKQLSSKSAPVRIEILSSAENIPLLDKDLHEILIDASNSCEFSHYVDKDGETRVKIAR